MNGEWQVPEAAGDGLPVVLPARPEGHIDGPPLLGLHLGRESALARRVHHVQRLCTGTHSLTSYFNIYIN